MMTESTAFLNRVRTAVPPVDGHAKFLSFLPHLIKNERTRKLVEKLASKCQIEHRYSVLKPSQLSDRLDEDGFFVPGQFASTARRMERYAREALPLAEEPVAAVLEGENRAKISHLIVTSCTGFYAPGLDLQLQKRFGLRGDVERSIIGFMGCYAAFNGLKTARHIVRSDSRARVLLVNLELCSLHLQDTSVIDDDTVAERVLGYLQFADGCAASIVSADEDGLALERFRSEVVSDRADLIRWNVVDTGFDMILSPDVPGALGKELATLMPKLISGEERGRMKHWAVHPGGRSILDAVQSRLELTDQEMASSRSVLRDYGNMSSATIMFVLKKILEEKDPGLGMAMAFGPGLTVESMVFAKGRA
jgi:predicted naringenin-chalcone synthase